MRSLVVDYIFYYAAKIATIFVLAKNKVIFYLY